MEVKGKRLSSNNLILKTWERCISIRCPRKSCPSMETQHNSLIDNKHSPLVMDVSGVDTQCCKRARKGFFAVYVGPEKQRFVIKAEYANHPLFLELLEEAELEFGFNSNGPLELPCSVDLYSEVLLAIDGDAEEDVILRQLGCRFAISFGGYRALLNAPPIR